MIKAKGRKKSGKKIVSLLLGGIMLVACFAGCAGNPGDETGNGNEPGTNPPDWSQSGDGWVQLFQDRKFENGFGAGWIYGTSFSGDSGLKKGPPLTYRDIGQDILIQPLGKATKDDGVTASGLEQNVYWELEEGAKQNIIDEYGSPVSELHDFRLCINSEVEENTDARMLITQYNDYMHKHYPEMYNSNPKFVKSLESNKQGKLTVHYNSYNDISNSAYAYTSDFANNTWPHLYIHQNFREEIDVGQFNKMDFQVTMKVTKAEQINTWPDGPSDRYDQKEYGSAITHSPSEASLQGTFFFRKKDAPTSGFFVGINFWSSRSSNQAEICNADQHGQAFYRIGPGESQGSFYDLSDEKLEIGKEVTVSYDLYKMVNYVLIRKLMSGSETMQSGGQTVANPWYGITPEDLTLSFYQVGWENIGNWDCEFEMSNLSLKAYTK